jgi:hypothetical protein
MSTPRMAATTMNTAPPPWSASTGISTYGRAAVVIRLIE